MSRNNGDISTKDIIDFSFNPGSLTPHNGKPVLKMKISTVLYRLDNFTAPWNWGRHV